MTITGFYQNDSYFSDKDRKHCQQNAKFSPVSNTASTLNDGLQRNRKVEICEEGHVTCNVYDFVMWSADMKSGMRVWDTRKDERNLFSKTHQWYECEPGNI